MYLSLLHVNVRDRPGHLWLGNLYRVHQRLWMAFPDQQQKIDDPYFLNTWSGPPIPDPKPNRNDAGFLFRIEREGPPAILVQSVQKPDWDYAFQNAPYLLSRSPIVRELSVSPAYNARYRFRLLAHVVTRRSVERKGTRTTRSGIVVTKRGRKDSFVQPAPIPDELPICLIERQRALSARWNPWREWLKERGAENGFDVADTEAAPLLVQPVHAVVRHPKRQKAMRYNAGLFDGVLACTDPNKLREALVRGIGTAKAFGFGLLSIAPVR